MLALRRGPRHKGPRQAPGNKGSSLWTASRKWDLNLPPEEPNSAITLSDLEAATPLEPREGVQACCAW